MMIHNGETYQTNFQRAALLIESTCAPEPLESGRAKAWIFMKSVYGVFRDEAEAIGLKVCPDTYFGRWEQQKGREQDVKSIRGSIDKIMGFIGIFQSFVKLSEWTENGLVLEKEKLKIPALFYKVLDKMQVAYQKKDEITIVLEKECADALKELAKIAEANATDTEGKKREDYELVYFSRIVYEPKKDWLTENLDQIMNANGRLISLCEELEKQGFYHQVYIDGRRLSMNYLKNCVANPGPLKMSFGERTRLGIEVSMEDIHLDAAILSLRLPYYRTMLEKFDQYPSEMQAFMLEHTKTCDGCRYCVQTDKTGKKPLAAVPVTGSRKCPIYPSFSYSFSEIPDILGKFLLACEETLCLEQ